MVNGWVKTYRSIIEWAWYKDSNTMRLFLHLILIANHKDGKWREVVVKRGQVITGRKQLALDLSISEQSIRTSLNRLKSTNEITIESNNQYSLITIVNYGIYQGNGIDDDQQNNHQTNQQLTSNQPATNQQLTTNKNVKNVKKDKKERNVDSCVVDDTQPKATKSCPYEEIVEYLNGKTNFHYKHTTVKTQKEIRARFKEGFTLDDFKIVIDKKVAEWYHSDKMREYLRPDTLFGTKFEWYLHQEVDESIPF